ncbi:hypothetical protein M0P98_01140 [bacterium]|jgi:positive regulator of sigma E activity|nr:hypothetical protein [bacterium]
MKDNKEFKKTPLWEDVAIIVSIVTLWPTVLNRESIVSRIVLIVVLLLLGFILIRRFKRFNSVFNK